jgi:hypothetical protein
MSLSLGYDRLGELVAAALLVVAEGDQHDRRVEEEQPSRSGTVRPAAGVVDHSDWSARGAPPMEGAAEPS